jgi:signal transduction histidine kinase/ActR/RegA family two-component response regulator
VKRERAPKALPAREHEDQRRRVEEAEDALRALKSGEADAVLVETGGERVFTLEPVEKPYRLLVTQIQYPAAILNVDGAIISCNRLFADLLLRPLHTLVNEPMQRLVTPEARPALETLLRDGMAADAEGEVALKRADGASVPAYLGVRALHEGALGPCLIVTDLTELRHYQELIRTQDALRASEARLLEANRKKDEFVATLAHELRNPLAPMRSAVEILKAGGASQQEREWASAVLDRQVQQMARLLEDLLDVSRLSRNRLALRAEAVELTAVLDAALETSRPAIEAGGHELILALPPEPLRLNGDPARLAQVFANLLNNAAKYTETSGRIRLTAERQGDDVVVSVADSGIGISAEVLPHVFEIFSQAKPALERSQGGLGIGLSLVKGLADLHGGSVEARSEGPGRGSEFVVRLPLCDAPARQASQTHTAEPVPTAKYSILIADDNQDSADGMAMNLKRMGNDSSTAYDGEQAVQAAEALRPDVVLLDLGMPKLNGYDACRRIREQPWGKRMFLVALTGWGQEDDVRRTEEAGFDRHVVKPVDPAVLNKLLSSLVAEKRSQPAKR